MTGYDFHPDAETDLDEIWEYIAADNVNAADRAIASIHQVIEGIVPFPHQVQTNGSDQPSDAFQASARLPDRLRAG